MITKFTINADALRRISGSSSKDLEVAHSAVEQWREFVAQQYKVIEAFVVLDEAITVSDVARLRSALSAIRHIHGKLQELSQFHSNGQLAGAFDEPLHNVSEIHEKAEKQVPELLRYVDG